MLIAFSRVSGLLTYQCRHTNCRSISKPRRQWASQFLRRYLPAPMRLSNKGVMSAVGPKQTFHFALHMSAFEGKADMARISHRLLMAQGGHPAVARKLGYA